MYVRAYTYIHTCIAAWQTSLTCMFRSHIRHGRGDFIPCICARTDIYIQEPELRPIYLSTARVCLSVCLSVVLLSVPDAVLVRLAAVPSPVRSLPVCCALDALLDGCLAVLSLTRVAHSGAFASLTATRVLSLAHPMSYSGFVYVLP